MTFVSAILPQISVRDVDAPDVERTWQRPVSSYGARHLFERSSDTNRLVLTRCGMTVNPGFAVKGNGKKCEICEFGFNVLRARGIA